jgi:Na+/proline symporter
MSLTVLDWSIIAAYMIFSLIIGFLVKENAGKDRVTYFLAGRSLPWWWAGISIAATTFAADTPLAITGIIANKGFSGNWIWLSWMGVHALVFVAFAARWRKTKVITDAEFISVRYQGRAAGFLRYLRASIYGLVFNCIILGWVLKAMVKIAAPFFRWEAWIPGVYAAISSIWPEGSSLGTVSDGITIITLLLVVVIYSSLGGIRGVIFTDVIQFFLAISGSFYFAFLAWNKVGGKAGLLSGLENLYGENHSYLTFFPEGSQIFSGAAGFVGILFVAYLFVQSYSNMPADGGGYLMQRLATTKSGRDAAKASLLFLVIQYVIRIWPWIVVALAALVFYPLNDVPAIADRETTYPLLMGELLGPGLLGLMITSLLAAFMSTVDTHINWGASYVVNDVYCRIRPHASSRSQILVARLSVILFGIMAFFTALNISTIEQAWKWIAVTGAALGLPTMIRWLWWRVSALSEIVAIATGLSLTILCWNILELQYELSLIFISLGSLLGMVATIMVSPPPSQEATRVFIKLADPKGIWPDRSVKQGVREIMEDVLSGAALIGGVIMVLYGVHSLLFGADGWMGWSWLTFGVSLFILLTWRPKLIFKSSVEEA